MNDEQAVPPAAGPIAGQRAAGRPGGAPTPLAAGSVPEPVARLAAGAGLGAYVAERGWGSPWQKAGQSLLLVVAAIVGEILIRVLGILFLLNVPLLLMFVGGVSNAIAALVRGRQDNYLFAAGLVHARGAALRVVRWPEVTRLGKSAGNRGLTGGRRFPLHLHDGGTINIPLVLVDGRDEFMGRLADLLRQHGRPVE